MRLITDTDTDTEADEGDGDRAEEPRSPWRAACLIGSAATAVRMLWVIVWSREPKGLSDMTLYRLFAEQIADGQGYLSLGQHPTAYYPPGYPYFLGLLQWTLDRVGLGDHLLTAVGLSQALLGGLATGAVVLAGCRLGGRRVGLIAGVLMALWPNLIVHSSLLLSETLFLAVFSVALAAVVMIRPVAPWFSLPLVVASLAFGLCTLIRPQSTLLALPAVVIVWAVASVGWRMLVARAAVLGLGVLLMVAPWTIRNAVVLDGFVPVSTNTGDNLCMGFNPDATGGFMAAPYCETGEFYVQGVKQELRRDTEARRLAVTWALHNLGELPSLSVRKVQIAYSNDRDGLRALESFGEDPFLGGLTRSALGAIVDIYFFGVLVMAVAGIVLNTRVGWRRRREDQVPLLVVALTISSAMVPVISFADTRFKVPVAPCYALLAASATAWALTWRESRRDPTPGVT